MVKPTEPDSIAGRLATGAAVGALGLVAVASVAAAAVTVAMARTVIMPPRRREEDIRILKVSASTVTLSATLDSLTPGQYSLWFDQDRGHARVGEIIDFTPTTVTRALLAVDFGDLATATRCRFNGMFFIGPEELGFPFENVDVATPVGPAPAWLIPADSESDDWVIQVHGRAVRRQEGLRAVPVFRQAGYTSLLISYRNDGDAPDSGDNRYGLGTTECEDVDAAVRFALERGAKNIVLMGWSMGGATVLQAATRSDYAGVIRGIVLDSPVIDWVSVLDSQVAARRLPPPISRAAIAVMSTGWGRRLTGQSEPIDFTRLDFVARASELTESILLMHSDDDDFVPSTASRTLALARPDIVTFVPFVTARHTKLWNYDSPKWSAAIAHWLGELAREGESGAAESGAAESGESISG